jgi:hypothetical protein
LPLSDRQELELEALMRQRRVGEARLNRALGELLGSGVGVDEALEALDEMESILRNLAALIDRLRS